MRVILLRFLLAAVLCTTVWARDDQRINQLKQGISSLEAVMADRNSPSSDRPRLQRKLDALKKELGILNEREAIESRERSLKAAVQSRTRERLRSELQTVSSVATAAEARRQQLDASRAKAAAERMALISQLDSPPAPLTEAMRLELDEQLYTKNEEIRAIALQQEAVEYELMLIQLGKKLRERLMNDDGPVVRLTMRTWFEMRAEQQQYLNREKQLEAMLANVLENLRVTEDGAALAQQKLTKFDEELQLLERQVSFLHRNEPLEQLLARQRAQKKYLALRLPLLADQVEAIRLSRDYLQTQQSLAAQETMLLAEELESLQSAYFEHLLPPATAVAVILLVYLLSSRIVLPRRYKKEELFMARRLGRYATFLLITGIVVLYTMEDLRVIAATLGLVSAAIVIALQDVCVSFFGWSVIMVSRKFTIGDRLEIEGSRGDVLDIQLLRTTLLEVNNWLGVDQPTGRVIIIPNSFVFRSRVFNFSHCHPYIWGKVEVTVTFSTPAADATALFEKVLEEETREDFAEAQKAATITKERYGVEDAEYAPKIYTRIADSGITFSLLYVSHYRNTSLARNRINLRLIAELERNKDIQLAYNTLSVLATAAQLDQPSAVLHSRAPFPSRPRE